MIDNFEVTLAHPKSEKKTDYSTPTYIQPKLDGVRCYITKDGAFSRNHKPFFTVDHIREELAPIFEERPNMVFDGELYNHDLKKDFEKIISLVKKTKPTPEDLVEARVMVEFHNYDIYDTSNPLLTFSHRDRLIEFLHADFGLNKVKTVPTYGCINEAGAQQHYDNFMKLGYEGAMLRNDTAYQQKRSHDLMKMKVFYDTEGTIVDVIEGKGKLEGKVGKFVMQTDEGVEFGCPMSGNTHAQREEAWKARKSYIGKTATFKYFRINPTGVPYLPIFKGVRDYE